MASPASEDSSDAESETSETLEICIISQNPIERKAVIRLTQKGCDGINTASVKRGENIFASAGQAVHKVCCQNFINKRVIKQLEKKVKKPTKSPSPSPRKKKKQTLRSSGIFYYRNDCLFCEKPERIKGFRTVETLKKVLTKSKFQKSIVQICKERDDEWSRRVLLIIDYVRDCRAADCKYHNVCYVNFKTRSFKPRRYSSPRKQKPKGRPEDQMREDAFQKVIETLESEDFDILNLKECVAVMQHHLNGTSVQPYSATHIKRRLQEHFKDDITFSYDKGPGSAALVILNTNISKIIQSFYHGQRSGSDAEDKKRIISVASKLLLADILSLKTDRQNYPDISELCDLQQQLNFLPETLIHFLKPFIRNKKKDLKIASIGQTLIQAALPRSITSPLQFGLAVSFNRAYASRALVDTLNKLGFCSSYPEVCRFETNAAMEHGAQLSVHKDDIQTEGQLQFIADNVDHNIRTLTGHGTFHGMGIMAVLNPQKPSKKQITRQSITPKQVKEIGKIDIFFYR